MKKLINPIICILLLCLLFVFQARSQFFDKEKTEFIYKQTKAVVNDYVQYANFMGDLSENTQDREEYKKSFIAVFDNVAAQVYNDLDPEHKTSDFLEVRIYADYLMLWYSDAGLKNEINPDNIKFSSINKQNEQRFYVTAILEKEMTGLYMGKIMKKTKEKIAIRIGFDNKFKSFKIVEITNKLSYVNIITEPSAEIYINGEKRGDGEFTDIMNVGTYKLEIKKDGYHTITDNWTLGNSKDIIKTYALKQQFGSLEIKTNPMNATVFVNGENKGASPVTAKNIAFGEYTIDIYSADIKANPYPAKKITVILKDSIVKVNVNLAEQSITIKSAPEGANIKINGEDKGTTPQTIDVPYGINELLLTKTDYLDLQETINNVLGKVDYHFTLIPKDTQKKLNIYKTKEIVWLTTSLAMFGAGVYCYNTANNDYEKYKTSTIEAPNLHSKIALYDKLTPAFFVLGTACLIPLTINIVKQVKFKKEIRLSFIPVKNNLIFGITYNF